jgi:feruloyl esterase
VNNSCVQGNWNGKLEAIGNGGYSGNVPGVTNATNVGFAGSSTDNGHSSNWCNAINPKTGIPNAEANCGIAGGGFVLDANKTLNTTSITDFIDTSEVEQTVWLQRLAEVYYGMKPKRTYWNGCSTGGRQGMQMAQFHPELFDGILVGAPAFNWNRFIIGELWPPIVVADVDPADCASGTSGSCSSGLSTAFKNAYTVANSAAVAACDANDGVTDGIVNEPRRCLYDAKALIGKALPPMTAPMTVAQAQAINMIWDGPRNLRGERLWGGITRGTSFATLTGAFNSSLITTYVYNWMMQDPNFDIIGNINTKNFATYFEQSDIKFADTHEQQKGSVVPAATDRIDLESLVNNGTKLIHYRGSSDPLIVPFGSWNYDSRVFEKYGVHKTEEFYRSFFYPGNGHCGGNSGFANAGLINNGDLFNALITWVEKGDAPDSIVAYTGPGDTGNSTLICSNPNQSVYKGGPATSASSYSCTNYHEEPKDLGEFDQTAKRYHEAP